MAAKARIYLLTGLAIIALATPVAAGRKRGGKRIVRMGVAGGSQAEKDLAKVLRSSGHLLTQKEYVRVATQLGATGTEPEDVVKVAGKLRAALIVAGKLEKEGRGYSLKL